MAIKKLDHLVITTAQPQACLAFYQALGFTARDAGGRFELFAGDFKINVHLLGRELSPHAAQVQPGSADLCFELDGSVDDFCQTLRARGLDAELGIVSRTGVRGPMRSVYLRDPDGNLVECSSYDD